MADRLSAWEGDVMESWRDAWRRGFGPVLPLAGLRALRDVLRDGDPEHKLTQGRTTFPPAHYAADWPPEAACAVGYCCWRGDGAVTVGDVGVFFGETLVAVDEKLGVPAGCRHFLNWFDDTPRHECFAALLPEVERTLAERGAVEGVS